MNFDKEKYSEKCHKLQLINTIQQLHKENDQLKAYSKLLIDGSLNRSIELEQQIEKMKCCSNCKCFNNVISYPYVCLFHENNGYKCGFEKWEFTE